jgi:class 3 adenylate cyclase
MDTSEALAPLKKFGRDVLVAGTALALLTSLLALWITRYLTRPIKQLAAGARRVAAGESDARVDVDSSDEFRELADAFNGMTNTLQARTHQLEQKVNENESLLLNILPASAAAQMRGGEGSSNQSFADVSVLFADLDGLDGADETALDLLKELVAAFDEAAERAGVEKVKTVGSSYLAVCGLSVQRPDHVNRTVEFARSMSQIVRRFNAERGLQLSIDIGVNAGPVVGGIVGTNKFIYDLWGDTVTIARSLSSDEGMAILVTEGVYDRLNGTRTFVPAGETTVKGKGPIKTWRLVD